MAVPGAGGGLGHLAIQYGVAMGFRMIAIDTGAEKEQLCRNLGAEVFVDFRKSNDVIDDIRKITEGGPHAVLIIAASPKPYQDAIKMVRTKGTVVAVGLPAHTPIEADVFDTVVRCLTIKGSYVYVFFETRLIVVEIALIQRRLLTFWRGGRLKCFINCVGSLNSPRFMRRWRRDRLLDVLF